MSKIESNKVVVNAPAEKVFEFLMDMNNIEKLLPEGKVSNWVGAKDSCSFKVQGGYSIELIYSASTPSNQIVYKSGESAPFPFTLNVEIANQGDQSEGFLSCDAQINPFLEMMVKGPLKSLFDYMAERLMKQF